NRLPDDAGPPADVGALRRDPDGPRAGALAREGLRHWRADRVAAAPADHLGVGAASALQHSGSRGPAVSAPSRPSHPRAIHPALGSWALPQAPARPDVAPRSPALPHRLASAVRAGPQPGGAPLELPEVRPLGELRPSHHAGHPDGGQPPASPRGSPSRAAEELLSALGLAFSCLT